MSDELFTDGSYAGERLNRRDQWRLEARLRLDWVTSYLSSGKLLELGPATGEFCAAAESSGFDVVGIETSPWAVEQAAQITGSVVHGDLDGWRASNPRDQFDAVVLFHTLEHVNDPNGLLKSLVKVMRPGGLIFIEVPNGGCRDARKLNSDWALALVEDHYYHYTPSSLTTLLARAGLKAVSVSEHTYRAYDSRRAWFTRRARWLKRGSVRPSKDLLRVVAASS